MRFDEHKIADALEFQPINTSDIVSDYLKRLSAETLACVEVEVATNLAGYFMPNDEQSHGIQNIPGICISYYKADIDILEPIEILTADDIFNQIAQHDVYDREEVESVASMFASLAERLREHAEKLT